MAVIKKVQEQQDALKKVNEKLADIVIINKLLDESEYTVSFETSKKSAQLSFKNENAERMYSLLVKVRNDLIKDINKLAGKYGLEFSETDIAAINFINKPRPGSQDDSNKTAGLSDNTVSDETSEQTMETECVDTGSDNQETECDYNN